MIQSSHSFPLNHDQVVITGMGISSAIGSDIEEIWESLLSEKHGIQPIRGFDASGFGCHVAAQVSGLSPSELGIQQRDARIMSAHSYLLMKCARNAYASAKIESASIRQEEIGFFAGMGMVDYSVEDLLPSVVKSADADGAFSYDAFYLKGYQEIYPLWPLSMLNNIGFCQAAISLDIRGENTVFSPHADSGGQAIAEGMQTLLERRAKIVLAGGVSEKVSSLSLARAHLFGIVPKPGHHAGGYCRPMSEHREGTILGEGCGILSLELRSSADERRIPYSAMITGYGSAFGLESNVYAPTTEAMCEAMVKAIATAGIHPSDIEVVIAHGDGTLKGDGNEIEALHLVYGGSIDSLYVFASKGALGNLFAGAPAVDTILGICMMQRGIIPPSVNSDPPAANIRFNFVRKPFHYRPKRIMVNAHSYEGQCFSLIIEATV